MPSPRPWILRWRLLLAAAASALALRAADEPAKWDERETRLANEYLGLLAERPERGRVLDLLWSLYEKHDATRLLIESVRSQAEQSPHLAARLIEAHLLWRGGDAEAAAKKYDDVLKAEPRNRFALRARADLAAELRQPEAALPLLRTLAESLPDDDAEKITAWRDCGSLALASGRNEEAAAAWEKAAELRPDDIALAREIAQHLLQAGFPERAAAFFERLAKKADPEQRLNALYDLARIHEHADQFAKAEAVLNEALGMLHFRDGRYGEFFRRLARLHERFGSLDDWKNRLAAEARKQPPAEKALSDLARFSEITVDPDGQIQALRELVRLSPDAGEYRWLLVRALMEHEGVEEAARLIDEKLEAGGINQPAVVLLRCEADVRLGKPEDAAARLKALLQASSGLDDVEKQILAFAQEKALDEIIEAILKTRTDRLPDKAEPVFELASFYRSRKKADEMEKLLERFIAMAGSPEDKQRRINDAAAFLATGSDLDSAIIAAREALGSPLAGREERLRLADLLIEQGEHDEAVKLIDEAWAASQTADERLDADERLISLLMGEQKTPKPQAEDSTLGFKLPDLFTGAGFAADDAVKKNAAPAAVAEKAKSLIAAAEKAGIQQRLRAAWWAYRAEMTDEALRIMRLGAFDEKGRERANLPPEFDRLLLDIAIADENGALKERLLKKLAAADPPNRIRHLLRLSETMLDAGQRADAAIAQQVPQADKVLPHRSWAMTVKEQSLLDRTAGLPGMQGLWHHTGVKVTGVRAATSVLEKAQRENPDSEQLLSALTQCYSLSHDLGKALALWQAAAKKTEGAAAIPLLERQAELLLRMQKIPEHVAVQCDIIDREPDPKRKRELFRRFAERLLSVDPASGETAETVIRERSRLIEQSLLERARRQPFEGFFHEALAWIHERGGDPAKAFQEMKQAYYTAPETPFSLDQLRDAALKAGDLKSAVYFQKQVAAAAPPKEEAAESRQLVKLLEQTFQIAEADRVRRRLESRHAQDAAALGDLAEHYRTTGQDEAERRVLEQITKVRPWDSKARLRLALKQRQVADDAAAEKNLRELLLAAKPAKAAAPPVAKWPLPITDIRKPGSSAPAAAGGIADLLGRAADIDDVADRLKAWLSTPRPEFADLPDDPACIRLRAIEELGKLASRRGSEALAAWKHEWSEAAPIERLWAFFHAGLGPEFRSELRSAMKDGDTAEMQFAHVWLLLKSHGMDDALAWASQKERSNTVLNLRRRLLAAAATMLVDEGVFRFRPDDLEKLAASPSVPIRLLITLADKLQDKQRYDEALAVGRSTRERPDGRSPLVDAKLAEIAAGAERWDLEARYRREVLASPLEAPMFAFGMDPVIGSLRSLQRVEKPGPELESLAADLWRRLGDAPPSAHTSLRKTTLLGLAGIADRAADEIDEYVSGGLLSSLELGARGEGFAPSTPRFDEPMHPRIFWESTKMIGGTLAQQGLGEVADAIDDRLDAKWGGVLNGPRTGNEFNSWRLARLMRRLRESPHPVRLRLIREHLASADMRTEAAVEVLQELGGQLEANGFSREAIHVYRRLPERAPSNSEYAIWLLRACKNALEIEPGLTFAYQLILAEPPYKPPQPGEEVLREDHARFLALRFDVEALRLHGMKPAVSRVLQGRIPEEVPYLRELALLLERQQDDAGALAAWERLHLALAANADKGLAPDAEGCLHRGQILLRMRQPAKALEALRDTPFKEPLLPAAREALVQRASLAAEQGSWDEFRGLMVAAVEKKSAEAALALAGQLAKHDRGGEALSFLTQAERAFKDDAARFRLRLEQLRLLARDAAWTPERGRAQIASLFRASSREREAMTSLLDWLREQAKGPNAAGWITVLKTETRSGGDRPLAAAGWCAFASQMPQPSPPDDMIAAWKAAEDQDRVCLDLAAHELLSQGRAAWAWAACLAAADIPSPRLQGRKLPVMARVAAALGDRHAMSELFADITRMPFPGGSQTAEWAAAFDAAGRGDLGDDLFRSALDSLRSRQFQQPDLQKAWIERLIRERKFEAAETALMRDSYLFIQDAARLAVDLYDGWGRLPSLEQELAKFHLPAGVMHEARFLAKNEHARKAITITK